MLDRYAKCPVCKKRTVLTVSQNLLKKAKRFPFMIKVIHEDHHFYINTDSKGHITDILAPEMVE